MTFHRIGAAVFMALLMSIAACSDKGEDPVSSNPPPDTGGTLSVSFATEIRPILTSQCAVSGCHGGTQGQNGLSMENASYSTVLAITGASGTKFIVPGSATTSAFYQKVKNPPEFGERMPKDRAPLSNLNVQKIRDWINSGALNN